MEAIRLTKTAEAVLRKAESTARRLGHAYVGSEHLLYALLSANDTDAITISDDMETAADETPLEHRTIAARLLLSHGVTREKIAALLVKTSDYAPKVQPPQPTPMYQRILSRAKEEAKRFPVVPVFLHNDPNDEKDSAFTKTQRNTDTMLPRVGTEHLLFALLCENDSVAAKLLALQNVPLHELYGDVLSFLSAVTAEQSILSDSPHSADSRTSKESADPVRAESYLFDMTAAARKRQNRDSTPAAFCRERETMQIIRILLHRQKNNPCLVGEAGVGKTAVVEGLAQRIAVGDVPAPLRGTRILSLDLGMIVAGARYRGDFEERLRAVMQYCTEQKDCILFLDEMHMLMGAGAAEGAMDAANLLKPALSRGTLRFIGATTYEEYNRTIARDAAMARRFQIVSVEEPDFETAYQMLSGIRPKFEHHYHAVLPEETLKAAISDSMRYLPDFYLPDKAIDLLDDACAAVMLEHTQRANASQIMGVHRARNTSLLQGNLAAAEEIVQQNKKSVKLAPLCDTEKQPVITPADIAAAVTRRTGIPTLTSAEEEAHLNALEANLSRAVIGQPEAVSRTAAAYRRTRMGFSDRSRPSASFLFYGPTGVGKTALCRALAKEIFGDEERLLRFDMSEYMEKHALSALIGAPPGYVGFDAGGALTEAVRHKPFSLLLFDEIEKAHPDILHLFLQMLDAGHITDAGGRRVNFRNTVIVMTTNAGLRENNRTIGFANDTAKQETRTFVPDAVVLRGVFSDEFLNRFDAIIPFRPLSHGTLRKICKKCADEAVCRALEFGITLHISENAISYLTARAYEAAPEMGARPIKRAIADEILTPLSDGLLSGAYQKQDTVSVQIRKGRLHFSVSKLCAKPQTPT